MRYEAAIRFAMNHDSPGAAVHLAVKLCKISTIEAERYIAMLQKTKPHDSIVHSESSKYD